MKIITSSSSARNNGQKHGEGKFIYANGCYIGQSKNGQRHGKGEYMRSLCRRMER